MTPLLQLAIRHLEAMSPESQDRIARELLHREEPSGDGGPDARTYGERVADALRAVAQTGAFDHIEDPVAWQREIRKDRPLPGRED